jgi:Sulfotransferase family
MTGSGDSPGMGAFGVTSQTQPRVPDFFIVGHPKSGTTALYEMLRGNPRVHMPDSKEPWFFANDAWPRFRPSMAGIGPQTLEDYLSLYVGAEPTQLIGDASSSYLWSTVAARHIAAAQPRARIVAILREPASFLHSLHLQFVQDRIEWEKDLRTAISLESARRQGKQVPRRSHRPQLLQYAEFVRYAEQLRRYHAVFPSEQVLVLIYDDFKRDNEATVRQVLRFLELDDARPVEALQANPTVRMRSMALDELLHAVSVGRGPVSRAVKGAVKVLAPRALRRDALRLTRGRVVRAEPRPPDERLLLELRRRFKPEVVAISEYLDRDLVTLWNYDGID